MQDHNRVGRNGFSSRSNVYRLGEVDVRCALLAGGKSTKLATFNEAWAQAA
jgi:hypothetical protein